MQTKVFVYLAFAALVALTGCTKETVIERQAPADVTQSFATAGNQLTIQKDSLNKVFLLMASGKTGGVSPQWLDLKPQVVSFAKDPAGKKLALLEENYSTVYEEIKTQKLLQTFDIVKEDQNSITFNWGSGLSSFVYERVFDIDVKDPEDTPVGEDGSKDIIPVIDSFVKSLSVNENNLEINQFSKVRVNSIDTSTGKVEFLNKEESLEMNIQIRAYRAPSAAFDVKLADPARRAGFFVTKQKKKEYSKTDLNIITKWDLDPSRGPITFLISGAVPEQYVQAATEGVLYWNKVFGREVAVVKLNADPQVTPQDRTIIIRWIPWLDAGAAYAQAQSDPLTGEILRGQIFMPSAFTRVGSADQLAFNGGTPTNRPVLNNTAACDFTQKLAQVNVMAKEADDSLRLRLAQDSVRSTVAHEAGHALGMRHNFAGSFSAKVSTKEIYEATKTYGANVNHPGLETSTSIMDYVSGYDDTLMSAYIKHDGLSYDKMVMQWAYAKDPKGILDTRISKFCTDEDISLAKSRGYQIYGCERFDNGNNPLERKFLDALDEKNNLTNLLFVSIMGRLYPADQTTTADINTVLAGTKQWAKVSAPSLDYVQQALSVIKNAEGTKKAGQVVNGFVSFDLAKSQLLSGDYSDDEALTARLQADLKAVGGVGGMFESFAKKDGLLDPHWAEKQVAELVASPRFQSGKTLGGRAYTLSADDQAKIKAFYTDYVIKANKQANFDVISRILATSDESLTAQWKSELLNKEDFEKFEALAADVVFFSEATASVKVGDNLQQTLELPVSYYSLGNRMDAIALVDSKSTGSAESDKAKAYISDKLKVRIAEVLLKADVNADVSSVESMSKAVTSTYAAGKLDVNAYKWVSAELELLKKF